MILHEFGNAKLYTGDVLDVLRSLPSSSVHCCVTSPPYYGLRDYGIDGQIGLEESPQCHIARLVDVFREVRRVLHDTGTVWLNYGDAYASTANGRSAADVKALGADDRTFRDKPFSTVGNGFKPKDLMLLPARLAIALQEDGWWIRSEIVWCKAAPMPESVTDRPTSAHEKIYLLSKRERYFYDADAVRELAQDWGKKRDRTLSKCRHTPGQRPHNGMEDMDFAERGRNLWNYWVLPPSPCQEAHFATFSPEIPKRAILAGTSERGVCAKCGNQWRRVTKKTLKPGHKAAKTFIVDSRDHTADRNDQGSNRQKDGHKSGHFYEIQTIGWQPTCTCDADTIPATVLDPFSGSATTAQVALNLGRSAIGIELNPEYQDIAIRRLQARASQEVLTF